MCVCVCVYGHLLSLQEPYIEDKESAGLGNGGDCDGEGGEARQERDVDELDPPKVLGDLLESIAGAIFVDSKLSLCAVWRVFQPLFQEKIGTYTHTHAHTHSVPSL